MAAHPGHRVAQRTHRAHDRLGLHHHAPGAAELHVVHLAVPVGGVVAQVVDVQLDSAGVDGATDHTDAEWPREHSREDGEDVEAHHASSSGHGVTTTTPAATSTARTHSRTSG